MIPRKLAIFTVNLVGGLVLSQVLPSAMGDSVYHTWEEIITFATMTCLSFIMINVGYEFDVDKAAWKRYISDYLSELQAL